MKCTRHCPGGLPIFIGLTVLLVSLTGLDGCGDKPPPQPNIVLIVLDTVRADHMGCYGYGRNTTPVMTELATTANLYTRARATSPWTLPSHASLFTGKFTSSHGAKYDSEGPLHLMDAISGPQEWEAICARGLALNERTLAQILKEEGYATGAVVGGPWMKKVFGLNRGFGHYDDAEISTLNGRLARSVTLGALKWLRDVKDKQSWEEQD